MADNYYYIEQLLADHNRFPVDDGTGIDWIVVEQTHTIDNPSLAANSYAVRVYLTWLYGTEGFAMAEIKHTNPLLYENLYFTGTIENVMGSGSVELLSGNAQRNILIGDPDDQAGAGDFIEGRGGNDTLVGAGGSDIVHGDADDDLIFGDIDMGSAQSFNISFGDDTIDGGTGNDTLYGGFGFNSIEGGDGFDSAAYVDFQDDGYTSYFITTDLRLNLVTVWGVDLYDGTTYVVGQDTVSGVERIVGTQMADTMQASDVVRYFTQERTVLDGMAGNDVLLGGAGADVLNGGEGDDSLSSGGNLNIDYIADLLAGGVGNDRYHVAAAADVVELWGQGNDTVDADLSWTLGYNLEDLVLTEAAGAASATGNVLRNRIEGNSYDNVLDGRGGTDTLVGGAGNDTYVLDVFDGVIEQSGGGHDLVQAWFSGYFLTDWVEDLQLMGVGNTAGNGNALDNRIIGNSGNNDLYGWSGVDTLEGGLGDDTYLITDTRVMVIEAAGGGTDTVNTWVNYTMADQVENLVIGPVAGLVVVGNTLNNRMTGSNEGEDMTGAGGKDILLGGDGNDTLNGGNGNDMLYGEAGDDSLNGGAGLDTVVYSGAYDYSVDLANTGAQATGQGNDTLAQIENITTGAGHDILRGNSLGNLLFSASGDDELNGRGGNDSLSAGAGFDTLYADAGDDTLNGGADSDLLYYNGSVALTVNLSVSIAQATGLGSDVMTGLENVTSGSGRDRLTGNSAANTLAGMGGADTINGGRGGDYIVGGAGNDSLTGGADGDLFIFTGTDGIDVITDFQDHIDSIVVGDFSLVTIQDAGADTLILNGATQIRLLGIDHLLIDVTDFLIA